MQFWKRRGEERLYKQWVEHNGLPSDVIPQREAKEKGEGEEKRDSTYRFREKILNIVKKILRV